MRVEIFANHRSDVAFPDKDSTFLVGYVDVRLDMSASYRDRGVKVSCEQRSKGSISFYYAAVLLKSNADRCNAQQQPTFEFAVANESGLMNCFSVSQFLGGRDRNG